MTSSKGKKDGFVAYGEATSSGDGEVVAADTPKFAAGDPAMLKYLEEHGYVVVKGVADDAAVARGHDDFWRFHEDLGTEDGCEQILRTDNRTWGRDFLPHPATGIITGCGFGNSKFCWNLRTLPDVRTAFEKIWGTSDLISSFDGGNAFRPWEKRLDWRTQGGWWHCDQNGTRPGRSGLVCVQGLVLLTPANEYTGGFCVIPGSHLDHDAFSRRHPYADGQGDFLPVPEDDPILTAHGRRMVLLRADPGDLILWDSRTIHCNGPALRPPMEGRRKGAPVPSADALLRLVGYVCCTPSRWCPPSVMAKRAKAALEMTTSTHWPHAFVPTGYRPPWWRARTPADFTPAEVRLILGDKGAWPGQPTPRKSLSLKTPIAALGGSGAKAGGGAENAPPPKQKGVAPPKQGASASKVSHIRPGSVKSVVAGGGASSTPHAKASISSLQPRSSGATSSTASRAGASSSSAFLPSGPAPRKNSKGSTTLLGRFFATGSGGGKPTASVAPAVPARS